MQNCAGVPVATRRQRSIGHPEVHMRRKRKLIVHREFQLKKAMIAGLAVLVLSGAVSFGISYLCKSNSYVLDEINRQAALSYGTGNQAYAGHVDRINLLITGVQKTNTTVIMVSFAFTLALAGVAFYLVLKNTSGISGQMILLGNYLDLMEEGIKPEIRPLRKADNFHDIFEKLDVYLKNRP